MKKVIYRKIYPEKYNNITMMWKYTQKEIINKYIKKRITEKTKIKNELIYRV